jgi:hypothetical protein
MADAPDAPDEPTAPAPPTFDAPHPNGAGPTRSTRPSHRPPWEFILLALLVAVIGAFIVVGWTFVGSKSPERLDDASAGAVATACATAQAKLEALPDSFPRAGASVISRIGAENEVLEQMTAAIDDVRPRSATPAAALRGWTADWSRVIDARAKFASDLASKHRAQFVLPATGAIKPVTSKMDDFVRENHPHLDACFTTGLALETVEGPRSYPKVTQ